jgi:hypothetical protein
LLPPVHTYGGIRSEEGKGRKSLFLFTAQQIEKSKLDQVFSESRSGMIAHKKKKRVMAVTHWKGMRSTIQSITKSCRSCQVNKEQKLKYGHLPFKIVIGIPWWALCVDLIGPYTLKGKDGTVVDFMALTMINPATSWFEFVELPLICQFKTVTVDGNESSIVKEIFDKTSSVSQ